MGKVNRFLVGKIVKYFRKNYDYECILDRLNSKYNLKISLSTLKRILRKLSLKRRNLDESSASEIIVAILLELEGSGSNLGYRAMCQRLKKVYNLCVKQKTVLEFLRLIDPEGVEARRRYRLKRRQYHVPGPNFLWHGDGHDKLQPYGFAIHGAMDGFSKKLVWLEVATTNNDPRVIANYYLNTIKKLQYLPSRIRGDRGTELVIVEELHMALRFDHSDEYAGRNSFLRGKSTHNQRIEAYWRLFKQHMGESYIQLFKGMQDREELDITNPLHIECLRFSFGGLISRDIKLTRREWNEHRISAQKNRNGSGGIPNQLFHCPEKYNATDCRRPIYIHDIDMLIEKYSTEPKLFSPKFEALAITAMQRSNRRMIEVVTCEDAYKSYKRILQAISEFENTYE